MNQCTCREALARLYEYLDGELTRETAEEIQRHLEVCRQCYPQLNFGRSFQDALHRAAQRQTAAPPALRARILELLRAEGIDTDR